jgi:SAM-dependent methyltransferase
MEVVRTHDNLYLHENRKFVPKEYFKFIAQESSQYLSKLERPAIIDIGCATGDFSWYLLQLYPGAQLTGADVMPALLERAQKEVPAAKFIRGDINTGEGLPDAKFDAVFLVGVHSIFDEVGPFLDNTIKLAKKGGRVYIFGLFNSFDVDVLLKARYSDSNGPWESGWNIFSKRTVGKYLEKKGYAYTFKDWKITIDLSPNPKDYFRSWTLKLDDGSREIINGMQVLHKFSLLEIKT